MTLGLFQMANHFVGQIQAHLVCLFVHLIDLHQDVGRVRFARPFGFIGADSVFFELVAVEAQFLGFFVKFP